MIRAIGRGLGVFGRFWWDFLVGDTPELFVVMVILVGLAFALRHDRLAAVVLLPVIAAVAIVGSAYRGRSRTQSRAPSDH